MKKDINPKKPINDRAFDSIRERFPFLSKNWERHKHLFQEKKVPAKKILLRQGEISKYIYLIEEGCLRLWIDDEGKDITIQFFFEGQIAASMESFAAKSASMFSLESLEPCRLIQMHRDDAAALYKKHKEFKDHMIEFLFSRFSNYIRLFISRIKDNPEERYLDLVRKEPRILERVPQHYIASYLGITPVSLSRIRNRIWTQSN